MSTRTTAETLVPAALTVSGVSKEFDGRRVLEDVDLSIDRGQFISVIGHSGCGKSTLLRVIAGLEEPSGGAISEAGRLAIAFQDSRLIPWQRVWRNVVFGLRGSKAELRAQSEAVLNEVGLSAFGDVWPSTLSGGQAQRVSLARALTLEPDLLLLDEPFGALDALTRIKAQNLVQALWQQHGFAVLLVTHDIEEAVLLSDRVIVIDQGRVSQEVTIDIAHPRSHTDPRVFEYRTLLLGYLGLEQEADRPTSED